MLKLFFHRDSKFARVLEAIGAFLFIPIIIRGDAGVFFWLYLFAYLFIRFCYNFNWYRSFEGARGKGQGTRDKGQGARDKGQGARGEGQGARGKGQGARGKGQGAEELGIRLHFKKTLVAASYIIFIVNLASLLTMSKVFIYAGAVMFAPVLYLNIILLYLHFRDKDERPPNYFSGCNFSIS